MVGERKGEGEKCRLGFWIGKHMTERQGELIISVDEGRHFCYYTTPLFLVRWHNLESWLQALAVKFRLITKFSYLGTLFYDLLT